MPGNKFMFATGMENSYPTIILPDGKTKRVDEMEKTNHYERWKEDFQLVKELGIEFLRYGPPYYKTHLAPGQYDWAFTDETFNQLKELHITPIVDLCHFGVPDWLENFQNPDLPIISLNMQRLLPEISGLALIYSDKRDFYYRDVFRSIWMVERTTAIG